MSKRVKTPGGQVRRRGTRRPRAAVAAKTGKPGKGGRPTLRQQLAVRTRELEEAVQQQSATSNILRAISNAPWNLQATLEAIAETATRLLDVKDAEIMRVEGDALRLVAKHG